jgi:hypothetical protein
MGRIDPVSRILEKDDLERVTAEHVIEYEASQSEEAALV